MDVSKIKECSLLVLADQLKDQASKLKSAISKTTPVQFILVKNHVPTENEKVRVREEMQNLLQLANFISDRIKKEL